MIFYVLTKFDNKLNIDFFDNFIINSMVENGIKINLPLIIKYGVLLLSVVPLEAHATWTRSSCVDIVLGAKATEKADWR